MLTIQLQQLQFFAYHGLYEEERINGNNFELDVSIDIDASEQVTSIGQTVDYTKVYEVIRCRMLEPTPLLETLAQDMSALIYNLDNRIKAISISVKKLTPPIKNFNGTVGIHLKKVF